MSYNSFSLVPGFNDDLFSDRFNQIDRMFSTLTGEKPISELPEYNLLKLNENNYKLVINAAGYQEKELDISVHNNVLTITGKSSAKNIENKSLKWLHKGIRTNNFALSFNLNNQIKVKNAELSLGLLKIDFEYEIPEEERPKKIQISSTKTESINK